MEHVPEEVPAEYPSVWGVAGNIIVERPYGVGGRNKKHGTRLFRAGAKVYLGDLQHAWVLFEPGLGHERLQVIGQHRASRDWILSWVRPEWVANWRVQLVYQPGALARLWRANWPGFYLAKGKFECPKEERGSKTAIEALVDELKRCARAPALYNPPVEVRPNEVGWVHCPTCGKWFSLKNRFSWTGEQHRTCGQRLIVEHTTTS